uniref:Peptidase S1 domain-containing protein n=1 Tax=Glossina palpalis gambiensis TaxID=67801 RepID=A0A1B0AKL2_9MUSC
MQCNANKCVCVAFSLVMRAGDTKFSFGNAVNSSLTSQNNARDHVSIRLKEQRERWGKGHICSGVLTALSVVITVGHCVHE